ncbi:unnamed protein product [Polarella glacialis]|uniref:Sugar transporter SWEET1 n=1 Tax=Polarella glacialis TaxID=89957 RepID=A0A813K6X2_POLGL|nr:unnamed protein product [Polarella glacialis]
MFAGFFVLSVLVLGHLSHAGVAALEEAVLPVGRAVASSVSAAPEAPAAPAASAGPNSENGTLQKQDAAWQTVSPLIKAAVAPGNQTPAALSVPSQPVAATSASPAVASASPAVASAAQASVAQVAAPASVAQVSEAAVAQVAAPAAPPVAAAPVAPVVVVPVAPASPAALAPVVAPVVAAAIAPPVAAAAVAPVVAAPVAPVVVVPVTPAAPAALTAKAAPLAAALAPARVTALLAEPVAAAAPVAPVVAVAPLAPIAAVAPVAPVAAAATDASVASVAPVVAAAPAKRVAAVVAWPVARVVFATAAPAEAVAQAGVAAQVAQVTPVSVAAQIAPAGVPAPVGVVAQVAQVAAPVSPIGVVAPVAQVAAPVSAAPTSVLAALAPAKLTAAVLVAQPVVAAAAAGVVAVAAEGAAEVASSVLAPWQTWHIANVWSDLSYFEQLLTGITFATFIKALCMTGNILVQISPYPQVQRWEHRRCTGEADSAPYVSIAFGGWQWCYYGLFAFFLTKRSGFLILVHSNCLGAVLGTYYTAAFYRHCRMECALQSLRLYLSAVAGLVVLQICALMVLPSDRALFLTGLVSSFCSFVGAISMLVSLPTVLRTKDSRSIPGPLVLANLLSSMVWCVCGWMRADPLIGAPNFVSVLSSSICIYLKFRYPSSELLEDASPMQKIMGKQEVAAINGKMQELEEATEETPLVEESSWKDDTGGTF